MEDNRIKQISEYYQTLEINIGNLSRAKRGDIYRQCAINCVKDTVMKEMRRQFEECECSLDKQYKKYGNTEYFHAEIIEPGHRYIIGYPRCFCPMVNLGIVKAESHCECSRQSILYVLNNLLPDKEIEVEIIQTVLSGGENCRFAVTLK